MRLFGMARQNGGVSARLCQIRSHSRRFSCSHVSYGHNLADFRPVWLIAARNAALRAAARLIPRVAKSALRGPFQRTSFDGTFGPLRPWFLSRIFAFSKR